MTAILCAFTGCLEPASARVTGNTIPDAGMVGVLVRPVAQGQGDPACVNHAHHAIDVMLARILDLTLGPPRTEES